MAKTAATQPNVSRTSAGLRDAIFDELDAIRNGNSNPTRANAVAKLASSIVETVRMEIEVSKHTRSMAGKPDPQVAQNMPLGQPWGPNGARRAACP